ncbi:MAG TPA: histidinol dehydrogenase [Phycisphaerales bacterium]|nr:histidinol dehydrogenase [Phycisphaerales bacterium]
MTPPRPLLTVKSPSDLRTVRRSPLDPHTLRAAGEIVEAVRTRGEPAVREYAARFYERAPREPLVLSRPEFEDAPCRIPSAERALLERTAARIDGFARAQRAALRDLRLAIPGGEAGHTVIPIDSAGCYAPAGRFPLPSSVLMTAVTARAAGCRRVVVATPNPSPIMLAAACIAGADEVLCVGGAHAIGALAFGFCGFVPVDFIAGPGNRWVTAAKHLVMGTVGIDMLAGPSELVVLADDSADPALIAADLLAQGEHDPDAVPILVTISPALASEVELALAQQLESLPTAPVARGALSNGSVCIAPSMDEAIAVVDALAPEHLEVITRDAPGVAARVRHAGAVFVGPASAEVLGDYGAGPNHTLPTGGAARFGAGLSVQHFLRARTFIRIDDAALARPLAQDAADLARIEGLSGHERAAHRRLEPRTR